MRSICATVTAAAVVSLLMLGTCLAASAVKSGLSVGDTVNEFLVDDITGSASGMSICYRCRYGDAPVVCVFARKTSDPLARLVKQIDGKLNMGLGLRGFVVMIPMEKGQGQGQKTADDLKKLAQAQSIKSLPLTIAKAPGGPADYQIAKDADVTVLMWNKGKVRVNQAYKGELTADDIRTIVDDLPKVLAN